MKTIKSFLLASVLFVAALTAFTSCDVNTTTVMFDEDNNLNSARDTVYSVLGIINKLEMLADQTVLLGEVRGDLVTTALEFNEGADFTALGKLANFEQGDDTTYNKYSNYYAVINNCNYFISRADEDLMNHQQSIFLKEIAVIKAYRAWTYLQLAKIYGTVPFYTEPLLSYSDIQAVANDPTNRKGMKDICSWLIEDLKPYVEVGTPSYSSFTYGDNVTIDSRLFFFPIRLVLGDLYLWKGTYTSDADDYAKAAQYYRDYLYENEKMASSSFAIKYTTDQFMSINYNNWARQFSQVSNADRIAVIPMALKASYGRTSLLHSIFRTNLVSSPLLDDLSDSTYYCYASNTTEFSLIRDSVYTNAWYNYTYTPGEVAYTTGDLRLNGSCMSNLSGTKGGRIITKQNASNPHVTIYRTGIVYYRLAEAINRAGFPITAFNMLKYGLSTGNLIKYDQNGEYARLKASGYTFFDLGDNQNIGLHAKGCGNAEMDELHYSFPTIKAITPTISDSVDAVENLICNEDAFESAFEGQRFFDLMRMSIRRNDPSFLASRIARRNHPNASESEIKATALYQKLLNTTNWFLPMIDK
ncbi:MAG: RagB/SusD family nutrient uptake outer membrane protein [Bacteroidota bacterium]|nr:RagB/SusD family nutrient uptake outer membrane protein [Bacteroidota bacterium]